MYTLKRVFFLFIRYCASASSSLMFNRGFISSSLCFSPQSAYVPFWVALYPWSVFCWHIVRQAEGAWFVGLWGRGVKRMMHRSTESRVRGGGDRELVTQIRHNGNRIFRLGNRPLIPRLFGYIREKAKPQPLYSIYTYMDEILHVCVQHFLMPFSKRQTPSWNSHDVSASEIISLNGSLHRVQLFLMSSSTARLETPFHFWNEFTFSIFRKPQKELKMDFLNYYRCVHFSTNRSRNLFCGNYSFFFIFSCKFQLLWNFFLAGSFSIYLV